MDAKCFFLSVMQMGRR